MPSLYAKDYCIELLNAVANSVCDHVSSYSMHVCFCFFMALSFVATDLPIIHSGKLL